MSAFDRHYSVQEVAEKWGLSKATIRRLFQEEPGVLKLGQPETRFKRKRFVLRIPETIMLRVHSRITVRK